MLFHRKQKTKENNILIKIIESLKRKTRFLRKNSKHIFKQQKQLRKSTRLKTKSLNLLSETMISKEILAFLMFLLIFYEKNMKNKKNLSETCCFIEKPKKH